jgi:hypothetical protein
VPKKFAAFNRQAAECTEYVQDADQRTKTLLPQRHADLQKDERSAVERTSAQLKVEANREGAGANPRQRLGVLPTITIKSVGAA